MVESQTTADVMQRLLELAERLREDAGFAEVVAALKAGHGATLGGVWGSSCALAAAALAAEAPRALLVVCPRPADIDPLCDDLALFTTLHPERFPAWESSPGEGKIDDDIHGDRLRVLKRLAAAGELGAKGTVRFSSEDSRKGDSPRARSPRASHAPRPSPLAPLLLVSSIQSLMQPVPPPDTLARQTRVLRVGDELNVPDLLRWMAEGGFDNTTAVGLPGEFSPRGGIVDVFAPDWNAPVRIELFGDQIESLRWFEVSTQRSLESLDAVEITVLRPDAGHRAYLTDYLGPNSWIMLVEPQEIDEEAKHYSGRLERPQEVHEKRDVLTEIYRFPSVTAAGVASGSLEATCHLRIESVERFSGDIGKVRDELDSAASGQDVTLICQTEAETQRLSEIFSGTRLASLGKLHFTVGHLQSGFRLVDQRIVLVSGNELFHRGDLTRPSRRKLGRVIDSFLDLREGDYVVHLAHGIGRYRGLKLLDKHDQVEEHLELEFHGGTKIYVPAVNIELVQKYVGGSKAKPALARIGGRLWAKQKEAAQQAVTDMAVEMLQLQAVRSSRPGIRFPSDTAWQREFDAAFPYRETPDQLTAIAAIKHDMQIERPMDRLLCGDVGYGKTEVAMRATFKVIDAGYQVAVLVPTTILCEQHRRTFTARMAEFPFQIAALSRFCTARQQSRIVAGLKTGAIDIVVGTHRLAQGDVAFANLGLVIIDEEQRFGVEVKERLKTLRQTIDVLTLTATPIPRTLHMSLLGLRDISNLETPPEDRLAVETRVTRFDESLIRHAVLRELNRGGQVFFVHNRVNDIGLLAAKLQRIVPEASIGIGHGQMPEGELEQVMLDFVAGKFDILLATTIVESGLDIPNANTMFIDEADRYGLADLHQLRGRVGRYKHRAYCYLLLDPGKYVSGTAVKRLRAIEEFSDMGAGFAIAMRDLEIRGAGNILGTQQSGHIAAVGYELYCELLERAVRQMKQMAPKVTLDVNIDLPGEAYIPRSYVGDMRLKIDLYRRLARVSKADELAALEAEMIDRFGPPPAPVGRLARLAELRIAAADWKIDTIRREDGFLVFDYGNRRRIEQLAAIKPGRLRIVDNRSAYLPLQKGIATFEELFAAAKSMLRP
ncbi:MAG TPA: transcription-repair coupling factor [Pirellulales bacterium]|jgi:transcription-repair coupling factor (superfamily II helicase)|nr:transcription-repair coupling factor [Pirellulales bacterium]